MSAKMNSFIQQLSSFRENANENLVEIQRFVSGVEEVLILPAVEHVATQNPAQLLSFLKIICNGLSNDSLASRMKRKKLIRLLIDFLYRGALDNHVSSGVLCLIFTEIDLLKASDVLELLEYYKSVFVKGIDSSCGEKFIEVFPKLLLSLSSIEIVQSASGEQSGREVKAQFIKEFCGSRRESNIGNDALQLIGSQSGSFEWHLSSVAYILTGLKDACLTVEEKKMVIFKTVDLLPKLELDAIPDVVYQLLSFIAEGPKEAAFNGICDFLSYVHDLDEITSAGKWESLKRSQGLVMLHMMHFVQRSYDSANKLLVVLKDKNHSLLSTFNFGLLLALSQVGPRFKDQVLDIAKNIVLQYMKECEKKDDSVWVRSWLKREIDFEKLVKNISENSDIGFGWEYALIGLRDLGFILLETHLSKVIILCSGKLTVESPNATAYKVCLLGKSIIYKCFLASLELRGSVIEGIFDTILMSPANARNSALFFIETLTGLVFRGVTSLLQDEDRILRVFDVLSSLTADIGIPLLKALLPLIKLSSSLRDALVVSLKKALFSRSIEAKKIAVGGLLLFLKHFKILNAFKSVNSSQEVYWHSFPSYSSQLLTDSRSDPQRSNYERLCLEVIGCLRRILSQRAELKEILYHGFCSAMRRNINTLQPIIDFLYRHYQTYVESDPDAMPSFKLKKFVHVSADETVTTMEAFGWLIYALTKALKQAEDDKGHFVTEPSQRASGSQGQQLYFNWNNIVEVRRSLLDLAKRVSEAELNDFELDKLADFSATATGEANVKMANALLSTYEALIGMIWCFYDFSLESATIIEKLYSQYKDLKGELQKRITNKGKKAAVAANAAGVSPTSTTSTSSSENIDSSPIDLICLSEILKHLICDQSPNRHSGLSPLRNNSEFVNWIFNATLAKVKDLNTRRKSDTSKIFETVCKLSEQMFHYYTDGERIVAEMKRGDPKLKIIALEIVAAVLDVINLQFPDKLEDALNIWSSAFDDLSQATAGQLDAKLANYGRLFQRHLRSLLSSRTEAAAARTESESAKTDNDIYRRRVLTTILIIESVLKQLPRKSEHSKTAYRFLLDSCRDQKINEAAIAKCLWQLVLRLHRRMDGNADLLLDIGKNIHALFGDITPDVIVPDPERKYESVTDKTAATVATVLFTNLDDFRDDCSFIIDRVKRSLVEAKSRKDLSWAANVEMENVLCDRLNGLAGVWTQLVRSQLPDMQTTAAIKLLHGFFDSCSTFVRYYNLLYQSKLGQMPPNFAAFAQFVGKKLKPLVSKFVGHTKCTANIPNGPNKKKKANTAIARQALQEMKDVSGLVFAIETFEKCLVELSKKSKNSELTEDMDVGHSRDFRIDYGKLEQAYAAASGDPRQGDGLEEDTGSVTTSGAMSTDDGDAVPMQQAASATPKKRKGVLATNQPIKRQKW